MSLSLCSPISFVDSRNFPLSWMNLSIKDKENREHSNCVLLIFLFRMELCRTTRSLRSPLTPSCPPAPGRRRPPGEWRTAPSAGCWRWPPSSSGTASGPSLTGLPRSTSVIPHIAWTQPSSPSSLAGLEADSFLSFSFLSSTSVNIGTDLNSVSFYSTASTLSSQWPEFTSQSTGLQASQYTLLFIFSKMGFESKTNTFALFK